MHLICLAQGLDLRGARLSGRDSVRIYNMVRGRASLVSKDTALGGQVAALARDLEQLATEKGGAFYEKS